MSYLNKIPLLSLALVLFGCAEKEEQGLATLCEGNTSALCQNIKLQKSVCNDERMALLEHQLLLARTEDKTLALDGNATEEYRLLKAHKACLIKAKDETPLFNSTLRVKLKNELVYVKGELKNPVRYQIKE